ncbi:MAG: transcriptional repressor [bacterium]|nr:transcriptional repressor [bacterium]
MTRRTQQRHAIRATFENAGRPLGPHEILNIARDVVPGLGIATVYRTLKKLVSDGELQVVELPGAPSRYELAGLAHHHHFHCRDCDRVFDVEGCPEQVTDYAPPGFRTEEHAVVLYGRCSACATG